MVLLGSHSTGWFGSSVVADNHRCRGNKRDECTRVDTPGREPYATRVLAPEAKIL